MATQLVERVDELQKWFHEREGRLARVAQDSLPPARAVQLLIEAGAVNPRVLECRRLTLWRCVQVSLELGLPIGRRSIVDSAVQELKTEPTIWHRAGGCCACNWIQRVGKSSVSQRVDDQDPAAL